MTKDYLDFELERLEANQRTTRWLVFGMAIFGSVLATSFAVYFIDFLFDVMQRHPEPYRQWIGIIVLAGLTIAVDGLTILYYFAIRRENSEKESNRD